MHFRDRHYSVPGITVQGHGETVYKGSVTSSQDFRKEFVNEGFMHDHVNGVWMSTQSRDPKRAAHKKKLLAGFDLGSPMTSVKIVHDYPLAGVAAGNSPLSSIHRRYNGHIVANPPSNVPYTAARSEEELITKMGGHVDSEQELFALGGTAISRCKPASPEAAFGTSLVELYREGIPRLISDLDIKDAVSFYRSLRGNYLNVEFGWKPFVADIQAVIKSYENRDKIIRQLVRNNKKFIRRQYSFPPEVTVTEVPYAGRLPWPTLTVNHWTQEGCILRTTTSKRTWFSGEFVYRIPKLDNSLSGVLAQMRALYGVDPSPETIWNVAPWMWLADWFANFGDVIANVTAITSDDLVMNYGYLMQETVTEYKTIHTGVRTLGYGYVTPRIEGTTTITRKVRRRASPYGFGLNPSDLTMRQWTILGALGLIQGDRFDLKIK